ncbi:hypothetical protein [Mesobacillus zeae]|uniref:hypothetical protein n=1 Tax=Mesobacillus zeae TaxID=1917180 RepID=UPI003009D02F
MELVNSALSLAQLKEEKWYYFSPNDHVANDITGVKVSGDSIFVQYIGGDFEEPFTFWFKYNQEAFNEMWQYEFRENYGYPIQKEKITLNSIDDLSNSAYTMINDLYYTCRFMGEADSDAE